jgi:hypothetical protein
MWDGRTINEEKVLLFCEQGLGDAINFSRFYFYFKERFPKASVSMDAPSGLHGLFSSNGIEMANSKEGHEIYCSVMDLPHLLGMGPDEIRDNFKPIVPSRKCDLSAFNGLLKVGVCWGGNPMNPRDEFRSARLSEFRKLQSVEGVKFFALQKDKRPRVWNSADKTVDLCSGCEDMRLVDMSPHMFTWESTAAIVDAMDIVISVDTSLLHLAASMGKKTWGLISKPADWRWGMEGDYSFWYPGLKLFRQTDRGDWSSAMTKVRSALVKEL